MTKEKNYFENRMHKESLSTTIFKKKEYSFSKNLHKIRK